MLWSRRASCLVSGSWVLASKQSALTRVKISQGLLAVPQRPHTTASSYFKQGESCRTDSGPHILPVVFGLNSRYKGILIGVYRFSLHSICVYRFSLHSTCVYFVRRRRISSNRTSVLERQRNKAYQQLLLLLYPYAVIDTLCRPVQAVAIG